jgi:hypothetical protein
MYQVFSGRVAAEEAYWFPRLQGELYIWSSPYVFHSVANVNYVIWDSRFS